MFLQGSAEAGKIVACSLLQFSYAIASQFGSFQRGCVFLLRQDSEIPQGTFFAELAESKLGGGSLGLGGVVMLEQ